MIIERFGHAALLVECADQRVLIDPGSYAAAGAFALLDLTAIVVTHQHADHADPERLPGLLEANAGAVVLAERGAMELLPDLASRATELRAGERIALGSAVLVGVGGQHAVIHSDLPSIGNVGVTLTARGEPTLFHPGDAYDVAPDGVDILAVPLAAPWAKLSETVEFVRHVAARSVFAIHDSALSTQSRAMYWRTIERLGGDATYEPLAELARFEVSPSGCVTGRLLDTHVGQG